MHWTGPSTELVPAPRLKEGMKAWSTQCFQHGPSLELPVPFPTGNVPWAQGMWDIGINDGMNDVGDGRGSTAGAGGTSTGAAAGQA